MKQYLTSLLVLVAPDPGETLFLYLAATTEVISMVLVAERSEQLLQGASAVPPVGGGGPASTNVTTGPASEGPAVAEPIRLNYSDSSALVITIQAILTRRTSNGTTHWSVGLLPNSTTVTQDRGRFTSHEGEFTITQQLTNF
jgi:hypothetical protein